MAEAMVERKAVRMDKLWADSMADSMVVSLVEMRVDLKVGWKVAQMADWMVVR
jgi:hypothetical protein